jgi:alkanesulfonate monooxygenase SsuD/methylene tetrahydromethanopterin reductase-like flavin-dependent oxidoreductase (luciferase family)
VKVGSVHGFQASGTPYTDREVWEHELHLADLVEPLGFDSIWGTEHHFSDLTLTPDLIQFLTYMAGRTHRIQLGTQVVVLPWHNPVRVVEQIVLLDHMSRGRMILGIGRGTGKNEYDGFRLDMRDSRLMFAERATAMCTALKTGVMEYDGTTFQQPKVEIRPKPYSDFSDRIYAASVSPESAEMMARLGFGVLIVPQKPWSMYRDEMRQYASTFRRTTKRDPPPPIVSGLVYVDDNADRAEEYARRYIAGSWSAVVKHYQFDRPHLKNTPGYEFHGQIYDRLSAPEGMQKMADFYMSLQPWGTPQQVYDKIVGFAKLVGSDHFTGNFLLGMPVADGERNMRLFAREVLPELQKVTVPSQ